MTEQPADYTPVSYTDDNIRPWDNNGQLEKFFLDYTQAKADQAELETAKQVLAFAISKLSNDQKQLKLTLTDQAKLGEWALQMKKESQSGAILFRAVKSVDN